MQLGLGQVVSALSSHSGRLHPRIDKGHSGLPLGDLTEAGFLPVFTTSDPAKLHMDMAGELAQIWNLHL